MFTKRDFKRFYTVSPTSVPSFSTLDTIRANKDLEQKIGGAPKKVTELRDGKLLIEVNNEEQSD